jgi:sugar phosphate permease
MNDCKIFYGWWLVFACFIIGLYVSSVIFFGFTAFFEPLKKEFGWSYTQISFAASLRGLEAGILAPVVGFLVHRFGSRRIIFCGIIILSLGLIFLSFAQSLIVFYFSFLLLGFGASGCGNVATTTAVANWFNKNLGKALGVMSSGFGASGLLVPVIVWLIDVYGWRSALIILGLAMLILGLPLAFIIRNTPEQCGYLPDGELPVNPIRREATQSREVDIGIVEAFKKRPFLYLNLAEGIRLMTLSAVVIHIMPYLSNTGISRPTAGLVAAAMPLLSIAGRFGFGWLGDVYDKRYVMAIALGLIGIGMLAFCHVSSRWCIYLFLLSFPLGWGGGAVLRVTILKEYFRRYSLSKIIGFTMGFASIGGIIGPTFAGWVFDSFGGYHFVWLAFCGLICLAAALILKIEEKSDRTTG